MTFNQDIFFNFIIIQKKIRNLTEIMKFQFFNIDLSKILSMKFSLKNNLKLTFVFVFLFGLNDFVIAQNNQNDILVPYRKGDKWGLSTIDKKIVLAPAYDEPLLMQRDSSVSDGKILHYASVNINGKYGAINEKGELFIPAIHQNPIFLRQGFFYFSVMDFENKNKNTEKFAIYNYKNKKIFSSKFMPGMLRDFQDGLLAVSLIDNEKTNVGVLGFIDYEGKTVIPFMYEGNHPMSDYHFEGGYALVAKKGKLGLIDKKNKVIYPFTLDGMPTQNTTDKNGIITLSMFDGTEMKIDGKGKVLSKKNAQKDDVEIKIPNSSNVVKGTLKKNTEYPTLSYMIVDKDKKRISKNEYDNISEFENGIAITQNVKDAYVKYGVIDENDNQILPSIYSHIYDWGEGYYVIKDEKERYGLFNTKTKKIEIPCKYSGCNSYMLKNGLVMMQKNDNDKIKNIIVNQKGEEVREITGYDYIGNGYNNTLDMKNYFEVKKDGKYSLLDDNFKEILPFYEEIKGISINGKPEIMAKKNGLWGAINLKNEILIPFEYAHIESRAMDWKYIFETQKNGKTVYIKVPEKIGEKVLEYVE